MLAERPAGRTSRKTVGKGCADGTLARKVCVAT